MPQELSANGGTEIRTRHTLTLWRGEGCHLQHPSQGSHSPGAPGRRPHRQGGEEPREPRHPRPAAASAPAQWAPRAPRWRCRAPSRRSPRFRAPWLCAGRLPPAARRALAGWAPGGALERGAECPGSTDPLAAWHLLSMTPPHPSSSGSRRFGAAVARGGSRAAAPSSLSPPLVRGPCALPSPP